MMREKYHEQLSFLHREMIVMGSQCEEVITLCHRGVGQR